VALGETQLGFSPLRFTGRNRAEAKRAALSYWYRHRERLALTLRDFFSFCRLSSDERTIFFLTARSGFAEMREVAGS
jgi:hypothetical protein